MRCSGSAYFEHHVGILWTVFQRRRLLLNARRRNQPVQLPLRITDALHDLIQRRDIADVDLAVVKCRACPRMSAWPGRTHVLPQLRSFMVIVESKTYPIPQLPSSALCKSPGSALGVCLERTPSLRLLAMPPLGQAQDLALRLLPEQLCRSG